MYSSQKYMYTNLPPICYRSNQEEIAIYDFFFHLPKYLYVLLTTEKESNRCESEC